jgi:hypothetical protein
MIQVTAIVEVQDIIHLSDDLIEEPTVAVYRNVAVRTSTGAPILRMTIQQTKNLANSLIEAVTDLERYTYEDQ